MKNENTRLLPVRDRKTHRFYLQLIGAVTWHHGLLSRSRRQKTTDCATFELADGTRSRRRSPTSAFWVVHAMTEYELSSPLATVQVSATIKLTTCCFANTEKANDAAEHAGK